MTNRSISADVIRPVLKFLEDVNTPVSSQVAQAIRQDRWADVATFSVDPRSYGDALTYFRDACSVSLLKKFKTLPSGIDKKQAAIDKWELGEADCFRSNYRLEPYLPQNRNDSDRLPLMESLIKETRAIIHDWIGSAPPALLTGRFGPGATFVDKNGLTTIPDKMSSAPTLTTDAVWYLTEWLGTKWGIYASHRRELSFVKGNRYGTAPKNAKTDRSIGVEPSINMFYQLALGSVLRERLNRRTGWDLDRAQDIHRQVACKSSVTREFATLDLSNASDTICSSLVKLLLPFKWWDALNDLRSKCTLINGRWRRLEKFSSMGNGFTFELETIIFAATCAAVIKLTSSRELKLGTSLFVFGDDIIVPDGDVREVTAALKFFGFQINVEKSFSGAVPFRESCGGDFFLGQAVRPYFLKDDPDGPADFVSFANGFAHNMESLAACGLQIPKRAWLAILDQVPTNIRSCRGPMGLGDIVIWDSDPLRWRVKVVDSIRYFRCIQTVPRDFVSFNTFHPDVVLACATYGTGGGLANGLVPREPRLSYRVSWVPYS